MAPLRAASAASNGGSPAKAKDSYILCGSGCKAGCWLSVLIHKTEAEKKKVHCLRCEKSGAGKRLYVIPPGANRDPKAYERRKPGQGGPPGEGNAPREGSSKESTKVRALEKELAKLTKQLDNKGSGEPDPVDEPAAAAKLELDRVQLAVKTLESIGEPLTPELTARLKGAQDKLKQTTNKPPSNKALEGKLNAALAHAKQCTEQLVKCEDSLQTAQEKSRTAEANVLTAQAAVDAAIAKRGWFKEQEHTSMEVAPALPPPPAHLPDEAKERWATVNASVEKALADLHLFQNSILENNPPPLPVPADFPTPGEASTGPRVVGAVAPVSEFVWPENEPDEPDEVVQPRVAAPGLAHSASAPTLGQAVSECSFASSNEHPNTMPTKANRWTSNLAQGEEDVEKLNNLVQEKAKAFRAAKTMEDHRHNPY